MTNVIIDDSSAARSPYAVVYVAKTKASLLPPTRHQLIPRHGPGQAPNVVLQELVLVLQLVVFQPHAIDAIGQRRQTRLERLRVPVLSNKDT